MKVKPWQVAVIVIGLLVGIASTLWVLVSPSEVHLADECYLLNVESGEVFIAAMGGGKRLTLPAADPESGKFALIRLTKDDQGKLYVDNRDLALLSYVDKDVAVKAVDRETGELVAQPASTRKYVRPATSGS